MADLFADVPLLLSDPVSRAEADTPHDVKALTDIPRAVFVGTAGNITGRGNADTADRV